MGVSLNWLAVERGDKAALLARLGLAACDVVSDEFDAPVACAEFPNGWLVVVSQGLDLDLDDVLPVASAHGLALGCEVEEHVMFSRLRAFRGGRPAWTVTHDPDADRYGVAVEGEPPALFEEIRTALAAEQAADLSGDVDYMFDAPVRLGRRLCGYSHDEPQPVVWRSLGWSGRRHEVRPPAPRLPEVFMSELAPLLRAAGWSPPWESMRPVDGDWAAQGIWSMTRVMNGRRQDLAVNWLERGQYFQLETKFSVRNGAGDESGLLLWGEVRIVRDRKRSSGKPLWRKMMGRFRAGAAASSPPAPEDAPPPEDPMTRLIARVKADWASVETFLSTGEQDWRIVVRGGSADALASRPV